MNISSIRNSTVNIKRNDMQSDEEQVCALLAQKTYAGESAAKLLEIIENRLKVLDTSLKNQVIFLENAYSSCDIVQPFGEQPENITNILKMIKNKIENLSEDYFSATEKIFKQIDIRQAIDKEVVKLTKDSDTNLISQKLLQETNRKEYLKHITHKSQPSSSTVKRNAVLTLSTGTKYKIQPTSGESKNCLVHAASKGTISTVNRNELFSTDNIKPSLIQMYNNSKSDFMTDDENFAVFRQIIIGIYNDAENKLQSTTNISEMATELSEHLTESDCFLDGQLAASILARLFACNLVILTPDKENNSGFSYKIINNHGNMVHNGELSKEALSALEKSQNSVFIYNHNGTHFEWLKQEINYIMPNNY